MRIARDFDSIESLIPWWCDGIHDLPYPLFENLLLARIFISYEEQLPNEERPPKRIWLNTDALKEWFAEVDRKRERDMKGEGDKSIDGPSEKNAAAEDLIVG